MVETNYTIHIDISMSELFEMVGAMIFRAETLITMKAPKVLVNKTIDRAAKFNKVLKDSGYDHWTEDLFINLKEKAQYGIQEE